MGDISAWWATVPQVTKWQISLHGGFTLAASFGLISVERLLLSFDAVFRYLQVWRIFTCFFLWKLSFHFMFQLYFLYRHSRSLEEDDFRGRPADYLTMILFNSILLLLLGFLLNLPVLSGSIVMSIIYVWSRKHPEAPMTFMFGIRFKALYLPWVMTGFGLLTGSNPIPDLLGIVVGHAYIFVADILPNTHHVTLIRTPQWLTNLLPPGPRTVAGVYGDVGQFAAPGQVDPPRYQWGAGYQLGRGDGAHAD
ncbi:derlin 1 [Pelomyxa schiedti]|nr:derlin 1 [Pelomyxa schiedti]